MLGAIDVARRCEVLLPEKFVAKLERMFDYYVRIRKPDDTTPSLNDSGAGDVRHDLAAGAELFPQPEDFAYFAGGGKSGSPPDYTIPDESSCTVLWNGAPGTPIVAGAMQTSARAAVFAADGKFVAEVPK